MEKKKSTLLSHPRRQQITRNLQTNPTHALSSKSAKSIRRNESHEWSRKRSNDVQNSEIDRRLIAVGGKMAGRFVRRGNGNRSERWPASDFSKKGSGKSASGSSFLFAVLSCARSRPLYRRRPRRPSGKSNNATCRFRLIYSRYPLEGPSTCKARVVICSHLERIGLRSPRSRKSLSPRTPLGTPLRVSLHFLLPRILLAVRFVFASVLCIRGKFRSVPIYLSSVSAFILFAI